MKSWGVFLIVFGIFFSFVAITMDTSVETGLGQRVNNLGLMSQQTNLLIGAGIAFVSGILLIGFSSKPTNGALGESHENNDNKKCQYCAEIIKNEAVICRYCGKEQTICEITNTLEDYERIFLELGFEMIKKQDGWIIIEPHGDNAATNTFVNTFDELVEYANSKRKLSILAAG